MAGDRRARWTNCNDASWIGNSASEASFRCISHQTSCTTTTRNTRTGCSGRCFTICSTGCRSGPTAWATMKRSTRRFAEAMIAHYRPGDMIWVHDYQLMLVPGMIREGIPARENRLLSSYSVSVRRDIPHPPVAAAAAHGSAWRGPDRISHVSPICSISQPPLTEILAAEPDEDGAGSRIAGAIRRVSDGHRRECRRSPPRTRRLRRRRLRAQAGDGSVRLSSGWIVSITRKAFRDACSRSSAAAERPSAAR